MRTSPGHPGPAEEDSTRLAAAGDARRTVSVRRFTFDPFEEGIEPESSGNAPLASHALASASALHQVQKERPQRF